MFYPKIHNTNTCIGFWNKIQPCFKGKVFAWNIEYLIMPRPFLPISHIFMHVKDRHVSERNVLWNIKNDIDDGIFFYNFTFTWIWLVTFGVIIAVNQFYLSFFFVRPYKSYPMHKWYRKDFHFSRLSKSIFLEHNPEFAIEIRMYFQ